MFVISFPKRVKWLGFSVRRTFTSAFRADGAIKTLKIPPPGRFKVADL
jgi:hypothetical protein